MANKSTRVRNRGAFHRYGIICRTIALLCLMIVVITNMMSYSKLKVAEIVQVEKKNESDARSSYRADILKNRLIEAFSEKAELSHLYNPDNPVFHNLTTPQGKAFDWMLRFDKYKHPKSTQQYNDQTENPTVVQRYILAVLFFATEGKYNNYLGSKFTPEDNRAGTWTNYGLLRFLSSNLHECSWWTKNIHGSLKGVKACDSETKEVTELMLPEVALHGVLPEEIGFLSNLVTLDFQNNHLSGEIPQSLGRLTSLQRLALGHNNFVGRLPDTMGSMIELETLYINYNSMEGNHSIPDSLCNLQTRGKLFNVWADCDRVVDPVQCKCCTVCCNHLTNCTPQSPMYNDDEFIQ